MLWRLDKGEGLNRAKPQRNHLQYNRSEIGAQNLRIRKLGAREKILLAVETNRHAISYTTTASRALIRGCLADVFDWQALHLRAGGVAGNACGTSIDNILDTRDRQRRFRNVGRQHNATPGMRSEDPMLLCIR